MRVCVCVCVCVPLTSPPDVAGLHLACGLQQLRWQHPGGVGGGGGVMEMLQTHV